MEEAAGDRKGAGKSRSPWRATFPLVHPGPPGQVESGDCNDAAEVGWTIGGVAAGKCRGRSIDSV
jgi:hypothetical protein